VSPQPVGAQCAGGRERYLERLAGELHAVGIGRRAARRILDEFADHLASDPQAELGDPQLIAGRFSDELGTSQARAAAMRAFVALALTGAVVVARVVILLPGRVSGSAFDTAAIVIAALAAQTAFVAGGLGLLRALRFRHQATIARAEGAVLAHRAAVGLIAGAITLLALPFGASAIHGAHAVTWPQLAASAAALLALTLAAPSVIKAFQLKPTTAGDAGDLFSDLGPLGPLAHRTTASTTRLALALAAILFAALTAAGILAGDGYDGILRGLTEAVALLAGYQALGRYLGLRIA